MLGILIGTCIVLSPSHQKIQNHPTKAQSQKGQKQAKAVLPVRPAVEQPLMPHPAANRFRDAFPLPGMPAIVVDSFLVGESIASEVARKHNLQTRMMWIDGTANLDAVNSEGKIIFLVQKIKNAGFNTITFDVKPISGQTLYPSRYAPKILTWRDQSLPEGFDPLRIMARECKINHISLLVSMNAFSEGHQMFQVGPGYKELDRQTVIYEPKVTLRGAGGETFPCSSDVNVMPPGASEIGVFNDASKLPKFPMQGAFAVTLKPGHIVLDGFEGGGIGAGVPTIPQGGAVIIGTGLAADYLRRNGIPGDRLDYVVAPYLVPISQRPNREIPLMMNPNDSRNQEHILDMVREVTATYPIDGVIFDDRLRYAGFDADFSDTTRTQFEKFLGHSVDWPNSCYSYSLTTDFHRGVVPGPDWDAWIQFRALTIRNFLGRVRNTLNEVRPGLELGDYSGSWYGEYWSLGSNWAARNFSAGFWPLTPAYSQTGFAGMLDFLITGCYYHTATIHEALAEAQDLGATVEAAGALTNQAVNNQCWSFAGITPDGFQDDPNALLNVLSAACATTQGVMVFDYSHITDEMWPIFKEAFSVYRMPAQSAHESLDQVRKLESIAEKAHGPKRPIIILAGSSGAGQ